MSQSVEQKLPAGQGHARPLSRRKAVLFTVTAAALALLVVEGVCLMVWSALLPKRAERQIEFATRDADADRPAATEAHPTLFWQLRPNFSGPNTNPRLMGFISNSDRMRSRETPVQRGPRDFRVLCLGDSNTFGWGLPYEEAYPTVLEGLLAEALPDRVVYVLNAGCPGYTAYQGLEVLRRRGLKYRPDVVTIWFGWNDATTWDGLTDEEHARAFAQTHWLSLSATYRVLNYLLDRAHLKRVDRQRGREGLPRLLVPDYRRRLREMVTLAREQSKAHVVAIVGCYQHQVAPEVQRRVTLATEAYQKATREVAAALRVPVLEVCEVLPKAGLDRSAFLDMGHLDARGHRALAEALLALFVAQKMLPATGDRREARHRD